MYIERPDAQGVYPMLDQWIPINIHITHERLQIFFTKFVDWLDSRVKKPWALFLPIKGAKLITDPYGYISFNNIDKSDFKLLDPGCCPFVYQVPTDPATREHCVVQGDWIEYLRGEYESQLKAQCVFSEGEDVIFRETVYKNLRGIFQHHPDPTNPNYSTVAVNMFSTQFLVTLPSRYLERYVPGDGQNTINKLAMFFTSNAVAESGMEEGSEEVD